MALKDAERPGVTNESPISGRHEKSPLESLVKPDVFAGEGTQGLENDPRIPEANKVDILGREGIGGISNFPDIPERQFVPGYVGSSGRHEEGSTTYGTGRPAQLSENDPFGNI
tara:strand:- start:179 stop:517 length:339 start_codon:yes stop_codon:yes gene_type:complete